MKKKEIIEIFREQKKRASSKGGRHPGDAYWEARRLQALETILFLLEDYRWIEDED